MASNINWWARSVGTTGTTTAGGTYPYTISQNTWQFTYPVSGVVGGTTTKQEGMERTVYKYVHTLPRVPLYGTHEIVKNFPHGLFFFDSANDLYVFNIHDKNMFRLTRRGFVLENCHHAFYDMPLGDYHDWYEQLTVVNCEMRIKLGNKPHAKNAAGDLFYGDGKVWIFNQPRGIYICLSEPRQQAVLPEDTRKISEVEYKLTLPGG